MIIQIGEFVRNKYKLVEKIGRGNFGVVYNAFDVNRKTHVAVKFDTSNIGFLRHEATILNYLSSNKCKNIPLLHWYGIYKCADLFVPCIVIPFYKHSLIQHITNKKMQDIEIYNLFCQMLNILESIHTFMVIHRDIKPDNFMFNDKGVLVLIDFGLSTYFNDNCKDSNSFTGNIIYASPNIHNLKAAKVVDDIISASYIYIYMCNGGKLQWSNIDNTTEINDLKMMKIFEAKKLENLEIQSSKNVDHKKIICLLEKLYNGIVCYKP